MKHDETIFWAWQQIPSPVISEILCKSSSKTQGVVLDTEHAAFNFETLYSCIQVVSLLGKKPAVRLPSIDKDKIKLCLDAGAQALIFSTIENVEQARSVYDAVHYPNSGGKRGLGLSRSNRWGLDHLIIKPPTIIAQIETKEAVTNIKKIYETNIFDYYMIGPYDLSSSLGEPGNFETKEFKNAIDAILNCVPLQKMSAHIPNDVLANLNKYSSYAILALGMDTTFIVEKCKEVFNDRL